MAEFFVWLDNWWFQNWWIDIVVISLAPIWLGMMIVHNIKERRK